MTNYLIIQTGLTGNSGTGSFVALASSEVTANYKACNAFDQGQTPLTSPDWLGSGTTGWVQLDLGSGNTYPPVVGYSVVCPAFGTTSSPNTWTFRGSTDGFSSSNVQLDSQSSITFANTWVGKTYFFANSTSYRYYRLNVTANNDSGSYVGVGELFLICAQTSGSAGGLLLPQQFTGGFQ